jgi:hypothetical protein
LNSDICLVHLVWAPLGVAPLRRFVASYARYSAGVEHRLLVVLNGFGASDDLAPWRECLEDVTHSEFRLGTPVQDLAAYRHVVATVPAAFYCFLNSYCEICHDGWLELMASTAGEPGVGAVGAAGSWGSRSSHVRYDLGLGGPYRGVFADRRSTGEVFARLAGNGESVPLHPGKLKLAIAVARTLLVNGASFPEFPSPHLRTNSFFIARDIALRVLNRSPRDKFSAYLVESGRRGITASIKAMRLRALVVGRDGRGYETSDWPESCTYWQGSQQNLLIEDNQTRFYREGDLQARRILSGYAWGARAHPAVPHSSEIAPGGSN